MKIREIKEEVDSWNWNLNIFEIYDKIKEEFTDDGDRHLLLNYAFEFYNHDRMLKELRDALNVEVETQEAVRGYFGMHPNRPAKLEHMPA